MAVGGHIKIDTNVHSDEIIDFPCTMCFQKYRNSSEAEHYCVQCNDYYCKKCVRVHEEVPALAGHIIQGKDEFPTVSSASPHYSSITPVNLPTERCELHTHQFIDMYCRDHEFVGCGTCIAVDHKKCQNTCCISEYLHKKRKISTRDVKKKTDECLTVLKEHLKSLEGGKQEALNQKSSALNSISQFRKEINKRLDELEKNTVAEAVKRFDGIIAKLEDDIKNYEAMKTSLLSIKDKIRSDEENKYQKFVTVAKAKQRNLQVARDIKEAPVIDEEVCLKVDHALRELVEKMHVLGTFVREKPEPMQKPALLRVERSNTISVKIDSDENDCDISSACSLDDGTVILSDTENKKLKRLQCSPFTVIDHCDLPEQPMQVCVTNIDEVAVSLPFHMQIQFASCEDKMTLTRTIKTDFECCGLVFANGHLYISDRSVFIYVFSISGKKLEQYNIDEPGYQLYRYINSISVSNDGSRIYIADGYNELVILNKKGISVRTFNDEKLREAYGSCLEEYDSLLLCGCSSNNVLQFGRDGELVGEIIKADDSKHTPQAICCVKSISKILIGSSSNYIKVYDFRK